MKSMLLGLLSATLVSHIAWAMEPSYCNLKTFTSKEVNLGKTKLKNAHMYQLGNTKLMGVAVGNSKMKDLLAAAQTHSNADAQDKYCTWYLNKGDREAEAAFNHYYMKNPKSLNEVEGPALYRQILQDQFANGRQNFLTCMEQNKYLAMGCNGQRHRGPTVMGMLLAFSGCSPQNAATIVNTVWGLNGVKEKVRLAIITEGKKMGDEDPEARLRIQKALGF